MDETAPFPVGSPLYEFPDLTDEVLFAYQIQINKLIYLNSAFEKVWCMPRSIINSNLSMLFNTVHADDKELIKEAFTALLKERQRQSLEFRILLPNNSVKWIKLKTYIPAKNNHDIVIGIASDITAEKSYSETLHKFNDRKNSVLQILAHDLLGPLGNIKMSTSLLEEETNIHENTSVRKLLDTINMNVNRGITMIHDLIDCEFLRTSQSAFVKQRIDIIEKIRTIINQYKQSPRSLTQRFNFITSADSLFVNVDESKFLQAINNLLSNSLKFTADDGKIEVSISEPDEKSILIKVQDNGVGIPADMQPFLFDKFTRARRRGIHGEPTTGLGMSIIKTIIEWHNGQIWFESTEGEGTTFYVEIPRD